MVGDHIVLRGHREQVAVLADGDVFEHALDRSRVRHELAQLIGILFDHNHGAVIDARGVIPEEPIMFGKLDLNRPQKALHRQKTVRS